MAEERESSEERMRGLAALCAISEAINGQSSSAILTRKRSHDYDLHRREHHKHG